MIRHSQITQSNKFALSLQYLKKWHANKRHANKRQSFCKLLLSLLMEVVIHVQNTLNRKLVIVLQYIKKNLSQLLCVLLWCKTFRYFTGVQSCLVLLVLILNSVNYLLKQILKIDCGTKYFGKWRSKLYRKWTVVPE